MTRQNDWDEILDKLFFKALDGRKSTREYGYIQRHREEIGEIFASNLKPEQQCFVEEIIDGLDDIQQREAQLAYRQGMTDCVWLLKALGMLA